jgi:putative MATE family efflux protein
MSDCSEKVESYPRMKLFVDRTPPAEVRGIYREIWRLSWPVFVGQGINALDVMITRIILGKLGETAFNTVNVGIQVFFLVITFIAAVAIGTTALVAQHWGAGNREAAGRVVQQSLIFGIGLCIVMAGVGALLARPLYTLMGGDTGAIDIEAGVRYLLLLFIAIPFLSPAFFLMFALRGAGDMRTPLIAGAVQTVLSIVLAYTLILGVPQLHIPRYGVTGAALAIDGAFFASSLMMIALIVGGQTELRLPRHGWRPDWRIGKNIFRIGIPSGAEMILFQISLLIYIKVVSFYGRDAAAGYFVGLTLIPLPQLIAFGFQAATVTMVGQAVGGRRLERAESVFRRTGLLSFLCMGLAGAGYYLLGSPAVLPRLFGKLGPDALANARIYIQLTAFSMPLMGLAFAVAGGLRGAGDTVPPMISTLTGIFLGRLGFAFGAYYLFHQPPIIVIWCSMFPDMILRIIILGTRLRSGKWKRGRIKRKTDAGRGAVD